MSNSICSAQLKASQKSAIKEDGMEAACFEEKLSRSLLLEDVAPSVSIPTIRTALGQFGKVRDAQILDAPLHPKLAAKRVLVEMATPREAAHAIKEMQDHPFIMMKGVPRPVIATVAVPTLFPDRPNKRKTFPSDARSNITCTWVKHGDPEWDLVNKQKQLAKRHATEALYLMQELRKEEAKLANEQEERAALYSQKIALVESCMKNRTVGQLRRQYGSSV